MRYEQRKFETSFLIKNTIISIELDIASRKRKGEIEHKRKTDNKKKKHIDNTECKKDKKR